MSVVAVAIVHRHGTRFPSKTSCRDTSFPQSRKFWANYGMMLTPVGMRELYTLGNEMRDNYHQLLDNVEAYSTNTSRTLLSSMSLLDGMMGSTPYIAYNDSVSHGVSISITHMDRTKSNDYQVWKRRNMRHSAILCEMSVDDDVVSLLDKVYTMTGLDELSPSHKPVNRLRGVTHLSTLIRYSESSSTLLAPNRFGMVLSDTEKELARKVSDEVYAHHFASDDGVDRRGRECVGDLIEILANFIERGEGVLEYSAHDTTILALASVLGIRIACPNFSAYFLFEIYSDGGVGVKYNPDPREQGMSTLVARTLSDTFSHFDDLQEGITHDILTLLK
jgi:hypothetical protein